MKQKYVISKDDAQQKIIISEFAELDKETLSLLCEERYEYAKVAAAIAKGKDILIAALRTKNMYPPGMYAQKIAEAVQSLYASETEQSVELLFEDADYLTKEQRKPGPFEDFEDETPEIEDLIEEDLEDSYEGGSSIGNLDASINIAEDDSLDLEDEV